MHSETVKLADEIIDAAIRGQLSREDTRLLCKDHPEVIGLALLAAGRRLAQQNEQLTQAENATGISPATPSGMIPIYAKPNVSKRRKKPGAKIGHEGVRRVQPVKIDERKTHRLKCCPHCDKHVEPIVPDAMPKAQLGHQVIALTSWFHYGLGLTIDPIIDILELALEGYRWLAQPCPTPPLNAGKLWLCWRSCHAVVTSAWCSSTVATRVMNSSYT